MMKSQKKFFLKMTIHLLVFFLFSPRSIFFRSLPPRNLISILDSLLPWKLLMKMLHLSTMTLFLVFQKAYMKVIKIQLHKNLYTMMTRAKIMLLTSQKVSPRIMVPLMKTLQIHLRCCNSEVMLIQKKSTEDKVTQQVVVLESKHNIVLKSLFEIKVDDPSKFDRAYQLDHLISLRLSRTLEDAKAHYKEDLDYHISTITNMLKVHDDMLSVTNTLIKQTHIRHEKKFRGWRKKLIIKMP